MRRRKFITLLGGAAAWPIAARAQQPAKVVRLGYIWIGSRGSEHSTLAGLRQGLRELGYAERKDFIIEDRYANSQPERLAGTVAELVRSNVDLILSPGNLVVQAAMEGTSTIPIIATTPDLLASGFVASLAHPGGNVTGISLTAGAELSQKWLEIRLPKSTRPFLRSWKRMGSVRDKTLSSIIAPSKIRAAHLSARPNWCVLSRICSLPLAQRSPCKQS